MRVLIVTYYWPPAGGPGVQRWLKFVKYLPEFGIEPVVLVPKNPNYPIIDEQLWKEIPQHIEVLKLPISEPYRFAKLFSKSKSNKMSSGILPKENPSFIEKLMLYIRGNFFIPDARIGWVNPTVKFIEKYLNQNKIDALITTGPPHSLHLIGLALKKKIDIPWFADFRDPWTTIHYHNSLRLNQKSQRKHLQLESEVLKGADAIIVTSPSTKKEFASKTTKPVHLITNGYDETDFDFSESEPDAFSIAHIGSLLSERNPRVLWEVLSELVQESKTFAAQLRLNFAGVVSDVVKSDLAHYNLMPFTTIHGYVAHQDALKLQQESAVLLLLEIDRPETRAILPGKLFEYLAARRPILALGPKESDIRAILKETKSGTFFSPEEKEALKAEVLRMFDAFQKGRGEVLERDIGKFTRRSLTEELSVLLKNL